jgi:hypothetical protein
MKTTRNDGDVDAFLAGVEDARRREDAERLARIMAEETGADPVMWGHAIVGFGDSEYTTSRGPQPWFRVGFSPRKASLALYGLPEPDDALGPHSTSKACLYIKDLRAVDEDVLRELIRRAAA